MLASAKKIESNCEKIAGIVNSCNDIFYVDNPPINIFIDDEEDRQTVESNKKTREKTRNMLLEYLEKVCQNKKGNDNFKLKAWDQLRDEIADYMEIIESEGENDDIEKVIEIAEHRLQSGGCSVV